MTGRTMEFLSMSAVTGRITVEFRRLGFLINMASLASGRNTIGRWVPHGGLETAVAMNIALVMTVSADKSRSDVNIQVAGGFTVFKGEFCTGMALQAGVHIFGLFLGKMHRRSILHGMTPIATLHVARLAVQVVIWDVGYAHESVWLFVPIPHAIAGKMQALIVEGEQTGTFGFGRVRFRTHHQ
jgi:hypothetical protein